MLKLIKFVEILCNGKNFTWQDQNFQILNQNSCTVLMIDLILLLFIAKVSWRLKLWSGAMPFKQMFSKNTMKDKVLQSFLLLTSLTITASIECPFKPQDDNYGTIVEPAYTVEELEANMDEVFKQLSTSCTPTERVYRSYMSGAVTSSDLNKAAGKHCQMPSECKVSKGASSLQAATCTELLRIRDEITSSGYTGICRHDLTNWNVKRPEEEGCGKDAVCTESSSSIFLQRRLSPAGWFRYYNYFSRFNWIVVCSRIPCISL